MARLSDVQLAEFLKQVAAEVDRGASMEGSIRWTWNNDAPGATNEVTAYVRNNNDKGHGGVWLYEATRAADDA